MVDKEKVVKGLTCCGEFDCDSCPYYEEEGPICSMYNDALELLKEQKPVEPIECLGGTNWVFYKCECNKPLYERGFNYCPWCGRKVKWDAETST